MFIFRANVYCDDCGERIRKEIVACGKQPSNPADESSYDSDDYPKRCGDDDDHGALDTPCHCASNVACLNSVDLKNGTSNIGKLLGTDLTREGEQYVIEFIDQEESNTNVVIVFWAKKFAPYYESIRKAAEKAWGKNWDKPKMDEKQTISNLRHVLASIEKRLSDVCENAMDPGISAELNEMRDTLASTVETVDENYPDLPDPQ